MRYINQFFILTYILFFYSCISTNIPSEEGKFSLIDRIVKSPDYLKSLDYDSSINIFLFGKSKPNSAAIRYKDNINELKNYFNSEYNVLFNRTYYSNRDSVYLSHFCIENKKSNTNMLFYFLYYRNQWYLTDISVVSRDAFYVISLPFTYKDFSYDDANFINTNDIIYECINDSNYFEKQIIKAKEFSYYFCLFSDNEINKVYESIRKELINYRNLDYKIIAEKKFSTVDNSLMNHRLCLEFENGNILFFSLVAIDGEWYIENIRTYCSMYPYDKQTRY